MGNAPTYDQLRSDTGFTIGRDNVTFRVTEDLAADFWRVGFLGMPAATKCILNPAEELTLDAIRAELVAFGRTPVVNLLVEVSPMLEEKLREIVAELRSPTLTIEIDADDADVIIRESAELVTPKGGATGRLVEALIAAQRKRQAEEDPANQAIERDREIMAENSRGMPILLGPAACGGPSCKEFATPGPKAHVYEDHDSATCPDFPGVIKMADRTTAIVAELGGPTRQAEVATTLGKTMTDLKKTEEEVTEIGDVASMERYIRAYQAFWNARETAHGYYPPVTR